MPATYSQGKYTMRKHITRDLDERPRDDKALDQIAVALAMLFGFVDLERPERD